MSKSKRIISKIYQYDLEGNFISEYNNASHASFITNVPHQNILKCAKNKISQAGNYIWSRTFEIKIKDRKVYLYGQSRKVYQYDLDGNFIKEWDSVTQAIKIYKGVSSHLLGKTKTCGKFIWKYKKYNKVKSFTNDSIKQILQYTLDGKFIKEWNCINDAIRHYNNSAIHHCLKGRNKSSSGFIWKYKE